MNPEISIIILNYNGAEDTIECLESLFLSEERNFNLIIIDNASESVDFEKLELWCKNKFSTVNLISKDDSLKFRRNNLSFAEGVITFIKNKENLGFAIANNIGTRFALQNGAKEILLLNNDTIVTSTFLSSLLYFWALHPEYVALTPKICFAEPRNLIWNCGGKITWFGNRRYFYADHDISLLPDVDFTEITFITGCALLYKPEITGFLTEQFFFGEEDFEFSLRLLRKNQKMACVYDSLIYHKVGRSVKVNFGVSYNRLFLHYVSRLINHKTYYSKTFRWIIKNLHLVYGFYLTLVRYKYGLRKSIKFWLQVSQYVRNHDKIAKSDFISIMKLSF